MDQKVYIFGQMKVKNYQDYFTQYGSPFLPILEKYNGKLLAATKNGRTLEGETIGNWTVLMQFPSKNMAYDFVTSAEYAPLMKLRVNTLTDDTHAVLIPGEITAM
tara:strand:+ start:3324 stop:3638 length:315 start_codon:yes stop_codon:yes gene_type:complete